MTDRNNYDENILKHGKKTQEKFLTYSWNIYYTKIIYKLLIFNCLKTIESQHRPIINRKSAHSSY